MMECGNKSGGHAALGLNFVGNQRLKTPSNSSLKTLVRVWSRRCAPLTIPLCRHLLVRRCSILESEWEPAYSAVS